MDLTITKFTHSCLLVEYEGRKILVDPGEYSQIYADAIVGMGKLREVVITHEHSDHFSLDFVKQLVASSPEVRITSTNAVVSQLQAAGIQNVSTESSDDIKSFMARHEDLFFGMAPDNVGVHILDKITHPGDCHTFTETKQILAMPMTAPWGSMKTAVDKILELRPEKVIPIHDWHWRPEALAGMYGWVKQELQKHDIEFLLPTDGEPFNVHIS